MKKLLVNLYFIALIVINGNAQTIIYPAWSATNNYNMGDKVSVQLSTTNPNNGMPVTMACNFICTQVQQNKPNNADPSKTYNGWAWSVYNDGSILPYFPGYKYTGGTKVSIFINKFQYVFYCSSDNQVDPTTINGAWAWYVDPVDGTPLPLLVNSRYAISGTKVIYNSIQYILKTECSPPQVNNGTILSYAWTSTALNSLWIPTLLPSPTMDNPEEDISRNGKVTLKQAVGYGPQLTLSNNGLDMLSDNSPQVVGSVTTSLHADGTGLSLSSVSYRSTTSAKINNDGTIKLNIGQSNITAFLIANGIVNRFSVSSSGNVVSNSETTKSLTVNGTANFTNDITIGTNNTLKNPNTYLNFQTSTSPTKGSWKIGLGANWADNNFVIYDNNFKPGTGIGQRLIINGDGNVGIGVLNVPTAYKLAVGGAILAEKISVRLRDGQGNWLVPDYVFKKDYKLPLLKDVETYVNANSHLPEVPSEKEINRDGIDVAQMNLLLLKKVEELTLYLIEQNKKIELQAKDIELLKRKK